MDNRFRSRKFLLALIFTLSGVAGLFLGTLDGGTFVALASLVLGLYAGSDVYQDIQHHRIEAEKQNG